MPYELGRLGARTHAGCVERRTQRLDARESYFSIDRAVVFETEVQQQRTYGEPLHDECAERDAECRREDQIAKWKVRRKGKRGGERPRATHPAPPDHRRSA